MKSRTICNILIVLFILVSITVSILVAVFGKDWRAIVFPLGMGGAVLIMFQSVIYKGIKDKTLIGQIPTEKIAELIDAYKNRNTGVTVVATNPTANTTHTI